MRIDEIPSCGGKTTKNLYDANYSSLEGVATAFLPHILDVDGVSTEIVANAQRKLAEQSRMTGPKVLENPRFYCDCKSQGFNTEAGYLSHASNCDDAGDAPTDITH